MVVIVVVGCSYLVIAVVDCGYGCNSSGYVVIAEVGCGGG